MSQPDQTAARSCPRCSYDLRGQTTPRCPECGLAFPDAMWATGVLRDEQPTRIDRCDVSQPHQIILLSLVDLLSAARHPRRLLATAATDTPAVARILTLLFGLAWVYLITALVLAFAALLHNELAISPATAIRCGVGRLAPRVLLSATSAAVCVYPLIAWPPVVRIARPTLSQHARLLAAWIPAATLWATLFWSLALLVFPDMSLGLPYICPIIVGVPAWRTWVGRGRFIPMHADLPHRIVAVWAVVLWLAGTTALATKLMPHTFDPRVWPYVS